MDKYEAEEGFVNVGSNFSGLFVRRGSPRRVGDAVPDDALQGLDCRAGEGLEKTCIDLAEDITNGFGFVREFYRECILKLGCQIWDDV